MLEGVNILDLIYVYPSYTFQTVDKRALKPTVLRLDLHYWTVCRPLGALLPLFYTAGMQLHLMTANQGRDLQLAGQQEAGTAGTVFPSGDQPFGGDL